MNAPQSIFQFYTDQIPFGFAYNFDNYLFNKLSHIRSQGLEDRADYFLVNNVKKRIEAKIHFLLDGTTAYSPYKSLFGSFELNPRLHQNLVRDFAGYVLNDLKSRQISNVYITHYAQCYGPRKALLVNNALLELGCELYLRAVNHHIETRPEPLTERMHTMEQRRLRKCADHGLAFAQEHRESLPEIYAFLTACRAEKDLEPSVALHTLQHYFEAFPQDYLLFAVRKNEELMAATVAVKVSRSILYNFLPASLQAHNRLSPMVMLIDGLYAYCQQHRFEMLDLGISTTTTGKDQDSLIRFKENVGASPSEKCFYRKVFAEE
jgi:hypothetical protein